MPRQQRRRGQRSAPLQQMPPQQQQPHQPGEWGPETEVSLLDTFVAEPQSWRKLSLFAVAKLLMGLGVDVAYRAGKLPFGGIGRSFVIWQLYKERLPVLLSLICPSWVPLISMVWLFKVRARSFEEANGAPRGGYLAHLIPIQTVFWTSGDFPPRTNGDGPPPASFLQQPGGANSRTEGGRGAASERSSTVGAAQQVAQARPGEVLGFDVSSVAGDEVVELTSMPVPGSLRRRRGPF